MNKGTIDATMVLWRTCTHIHTVNLPLVFAAKKRGSWSLCVPSVINHGWYIFFSPDSSIFSLQWVKIPNVISRLLRSNGLAKQNDKTPNNKNTIPKTKTWKTNPQFFFRACHQAPILLRKTNTQNTRTTHQPQKKREKPSETKTAITRPVTASQNWGIFVRGRLSVDYPLPDFRSPFWVFLEFLAISFFILSASSAILSRSVLAWCCFLMVSRYSRAKVAKNVLHHNKKVWNTPKTKILLLNTSYTTSLKTDKNKILQIEPYIYCTH